METGAPVVLDLSVNTRDRARAGIDPLNNTIIHMAYPSAIAKANGIRFLARGNTRSGTGRIT